MCKIWLICSLCCFVWLPLQAQRKKPKPNYLSNTKTEAEIRALDNKQERLYYSLLGEFSNRRQSDTASNPVLGTHQDIISVPIWQERKGEYWLYMGWYKHGNPEKALAQCIFKLSKENRDTFKLTHYLLPDEAGNNFYPLEWQKAKPFAGVKPKDLVNNQGCSNLIVAKGEHGFEILPDNDHCQMVISSTIHAFDFNGELQPDIMRLFTAYYDPKGQFLFDYPRPVGLELLRVNKQKGAYLALQRKKPKG